MSEENKGVPPIDEVSTSTNVAEVKTPQLPATATVDIEGDAGQGMEHMSTKDMMVPYITILQALSPQVLKTKPEHFIEGAEQGEFFNNVTKRRTKSKILIPIQYMRRFTEWKPRSKGGGMVADYGSDESCLAKTKKNDKGKDVTVEGNEINQAGTFFCFDFDEATGTYEKVVVSLSSTQLKKARRWNTLAQSIQLKGRNGMFTPALYYMSYKATAVPESNDSGSWFGWKIEPYKPVTELQDGTAIYLAAKEFRLAVEKGLIKAAAPPESPEDKDIPF